MKIFGDIQSGNCYKIKLLCDFLDAPYEWIHVDILKHETQSSDFLAMNPNGKIPVVLLENGECLAESNAILNFLAEGSDFLPNDKWLRAKVLEWQFFEQYSHEPFIAVARYIEKYLGLPEERREEYESKRAGGYKALRVLEEQLGKTRFLAGESATIADISLFAYTHVAHEGGFNIDEFKNIKRWISDIQSLPGFTSMDEAYN